ncbi:hypothetical protein BU15DRAFT_69492 [Melanogaster broomeanus]|nr:hypothetical protein BU15DRAFT_69492 [Melanogaster broomeanus]
MVTWGRRCWLGWGAPIRFTRGVGLTEFGAGSYIRYSNVAYRGTQVNRISVENLERPVEITHLLCSADAVTGEMRHAGSSIAWSGEIVVWEEWLLDFDGMFDGGNIWRVDRDSNANHYLTASQAPERPEVASSPQPSAFKTDAGHEGVQKSSTYPSGSPSRLIWRLHTALEEGTAYVGVDHETSLRITSLLDASSSKARTLF